MNRIDLFNFRISKDDQEFLVRLARKARRTMSDTLRLLIRDAYVKGLVIDKTTTAGPEDEEQEGLT